MLKLSLIPPNPQLKGENGCHHASGQMGCVMCLDIQIVA
jgi:hypothetical protein